MRSPGLCALLLLQAAAVVVHRGPAPAVVLPDRLLEPWELAERDRAVRDRAGPRSNLLSGHPPGAVRRRMEAQPPPPRPLDEGILNLSQRGLCYADPVADVYKQKWGRIAMDMHRGKRWAKTHKVIFAGLIRNSESAVRRSYEMLTRIGRFFKDYKFIVFENDSRDNTAGAMAKISQEDPRYHISSGSFHMGNERGLEASRMWRMATLRSRVQTLVRQELLGSSSTDLDEHLVVLYDFDLNAFGPHAFTPHAFFGALGRQETLRNDWDMLCANSLRHIDALPSNPVGLWDCFAFRDLKNDSYNVPDCIDTIGRTLYAQYDLVPVHSCFGGLAMYRPERFLQCEYDPDVNDCEHVVLHKCMRERGSEGRMFMDPLLTTNYDSWIQTDCHAGV